MRKVVNEDSTREIHLKEENEKINKELKEKLEYINLIEAKKLRGEEAIKRVMNAKIKKVLAIRFNNMI